jgi:hypothetical protein
VDGRTDLYGDIFLTNYLRAASGGPEWRDTFSQYGINLVMVEKDGGLARALQAESGWRVDYEDDLAVVYVREGVNE